MANNLLVSSGAAIFARVHGPPGIEWAGNIAWGPEPGMEIPEGITWAAPLLVESTDGLLAGVTHDIYGRPQPHLCARLPSGGCTTA
jgi:hypothetical protein